MTAPRSTRLRSFLTIAAATVSAAATGALLASTTTGELVVHASTGSLVVNTPIVTTGATAGAWATGAVTA